MEQEATKTVDQILEEAEEEVKLILAKTSRSFEEQGHDGYIAVAASIYYNDPELYCDVPARSFLAAGQHSDEWCNRRRKNKRCPAARGETGPRKVCKEIEFSGSAGYDYLCLPVTDD